MTIRTAKFPETSIPVSLSRLRLGQILTKKKRYAEADGLLRQAADNLNAAGAGATAYRTNAIKARVELANAQHGIEPTRVVHASCRHRFSEARPILSLALQVPQLAARDTLHRS